MRRFSMWPTAALVIFLSVRAVSAQEPTTVYKTMVKPFLEAHCVDCHGPDVKKAGLRLDDLPPDFADVKTMARWIHVHDKLVAGDMPPRNRERPARRDLEAVTQWLHKQLHAGSLKYQQKEGRVVVRRLNGTEYENTIRDLLGVSIELKELLPEDNAAAGFDNVSAVLDFSATQQLRYQEAAEKAVRAAIPSRPPATIKESRTGRQITEKRNSFKQLLGRNCQLQGDALIIFSQMPRFTSCSTAPAPQFGRYRVQVSAHAAGTEGKPLAVAFMVRDPSSREEATLIDSRDVPADKATVLEAEVLLKPREVFLVNVFAKESRRDVEKTKGPALVVQWMKIEGPIDPWPPVGYQRLFGAMPLQAQSVIKAQSEGRPAPSVPENRSDKAWLVDPLQPVSAKSREDARRLIHDFLPRAFRRPVNEDQERYFVKRVHDKLDQNYSFLEAMIHGYKSILSSPHFLLHMEPVGPAAARDRPGASASKLDDHALASRLSYFLWSTLPDDSLMRAAAKGELTTADHLHAQVERMLKDPRAHRFTENFTGQWLDLRKINATIPDPQLYGDYDGLLLWSMPRETELFFEEVLRHDLSLLDFVHSDWSILNQRLARHYGVPGVEGIEFRKVKLPPDIHRGGVMTQASVLKVTADGTRTSPILRGKWILERIVGKPPSPPPPAVPALEPDIRGATTIRQQLDKHRNIAACAACHNHIDPPGFALESYDVIGGWREYYRVSTPTKGGLVKLPNYTGRRFYRGPEVEKGWQLADGRKFKDIDGYKKLLLEDKDQLARNLTEKVLIYATGAELQYADREVVEQIVANLRAKNYGFRTLIHEVVKSRVFLNK